MLQIKAQNYFLTSPYPRGHDDSCSVSKHGLRPQQQARPVAESAAGLVQHLQIVPEQHLALAPSVLVKVARVVQPLPHVPIERPVLHAARVVEAVRIQRQVEAWIAGDGVALDRVVHVRHAERLDILLRRAVEVRDPLVRDCQRAVA